MSFTDDAIPRLDTPATHRFDLYVRAVLPLDGFVFWIRSDLVSSSILSAATNGAAVSPFIDVNGSLHYSTETRQEETETYAVNRILFTSGSPINDLNAVGPNLMYVGTVRGLKYAFSDRGYFYEQAGINHYVGVAVYPDMATQLIDDAEMLDLSTLVVSNSLPAWLSLNNYVPPVAGFGNSVPLYPSFLLSKNIVPPFASIHIDDTEALQSTQLIDPDSNLSQLCRDRVRITMFGIRNNEALDFVACVNQFSLDTDAFGVMNMPSVRDEKRLQVEMAVIAMKKSVEFEISYYQQTMNNIAVQLIKSAVPSFASINGSLV